MFLFLAFLFLQDICAWKAQLIDEDGNYFGKFDFPKNEKEASIVSIIGPQSSGKSTILNALFKTDFFVMDESLGMPQTTKGIWIGNAIPPNHVKDLGFDLLVLDIQGFDSRERQNLNGETYDNRAGLFMVSMSNVIIFNMWMNEVNRYRGGGTVIIENILQNAVSLNLKEEKKTLIFLVQNYRSGVSLTVLKETIHKNMMDAWGKVENSSNINLDSLFNIVVYPLPHILLPGTNEVNETIVEDLRKMFFNSEHPAFLHSLNTDHFADVKGVVETGKKVWDIIMDKKDLEVSPLLEDYRRVLAELKIQKAIDDAEAKRKFTTPVNKIKKPIVMSQREYTTMKTHRHKRGRKHVGFPGWWWINEECDCYDATVKTTIFEMQYEVATVFEDGHIEHEPFEEAPPKITKDEFWDVNENYCRNCHDL